MRSPTAILGSVLLATLPLAGCFDGTKSRSDPGQDMGEFAVSLTLLDSSCGAGSLSLAEVAGFEVELSRDGRTIYWDVGGAIASGELDEAEERSFEITSSFVLNMRTPDDPPDTPPCSIRRTDSLTAELASSDEPESFSGTFSYAFAPTEGSACGDLTVGPERLADSLPCEATYELSAERIRAPDDR